MRSNRPVRFVIGFAASEASGRFAPGHRRGRSPEGGLPGHRRLGPWLELPLDLTAEFDADLADIRRLIETAARGTADPAGS
ncbi:hypothetical protein ACFRI7_27335 [Streptomyces sp. NPDC056716]|uniref:hypothetical protein n=1 Tax=unclassified Streptomyces TaxID=2593676 RepID=UPI0036B08D53